MLLTLPGSSAVVRACSLCTAEPSPVSMLFRQNHRTTRTTWSQSFVVPARPHPSEYTLHTPQNSCIAQHCLAAAGCPSRLQAGAWWSLWRCSGDTSAPPQLLPPTSTTPADAPLCAAQVRPSITVLLRAFDVYLSSALYLRYHMVSSPALAVGIACTWNLAAVMLCVFLDQRNRRAFLRSRAEAPVRAHHPDKGRAKSE